MASENAAIAVLNSVITRQSAEIKDLHDKFLARSLPELKTYTVDFQQPEKTPYSSLFDEAQIGMIGDYGKDS
jgi:hypothetical protein